jgi:hypothetical protein
MSLLKELQDLVEKHKNTEELFTFSEVKSIVENTLLNIDASDFDVNEMELSFDIDYDNRISAEIIDASVFIDEILEEIQDGIEKSLIYCAEQRK